MTTVNGIGIALQQAICAVAEGEYARLRASRTPEGCLNCIGSALESLGGLQRGIAPSYDEWQALFYITWYQYAHVNLAGAILHKLFECRPIREPIHLVDLGCGAMATQLALTIYAAKTQETYNPPPRITVHNVDPSRAMRRIGQELFESVRVISRRDSTLRHLSRSCDAILSRSMSSDEEIGSIDQSTKRLLFAVHTVYETNKDKVKDSVERIQRKIKPNEMVMTCYEKSTHLVEYAGGKGLRRVYDTNWLLDGGTEQITDWRQGLFKRLPQFGTDHVAWKFLRGSVPSVPNSFAIHRWTSGGRP